MSVTDAMQFEAVTKPRKMAKLWQKNSKKMAKK